MDIMSRLPGCAGQAADAVSAHTQVKTEDAHKLLKIPNLAVSTHLGTLIEDDESVVPRAEAWERATATSHPDHTSDQSIRSRLLEFSSETGPTRPPVPRPTRWARLRRGGAEARKRGGAEARRDARKRAEAQRALPVGVREEYRGRGEAHARLTPA